MSKDLRENSPPLRNLRNIGADHAKSLISKDSDRYKRIVISRNYKYNSRLADTHSKKTPAIGLFDFSESIRFEEKDSDSQNGPTLAKCEMKRPEDYEEIKKFLSTNDDFIMENSNVFYHLLKLVAIFLILIGTVLTITLIGAIGGVPILLLGFGVLANAEGEKIVFHHDP